MDGYEWLAYQATEDQRHRDVFKYYLDRMDRETVKYIRPKNNLEKFYYYGGPTFKYDFDEMIDCVGYVAKSFEWAKPAPDMSWLDTPWPPEEEVSVSEEEIITLVSEGG